ncbi:MAG TPA: hypothetical protein VJ841_05520 [Candidatus Saccharimonadales bacterium]|nr:hypothetical protein [Candidatus Saccharimonadales bacterium]
MRETTPARIIDGRRTYSYEGATAGELDRVEMAVKAIPGVISVDGQIETSTGRAEIRLSLAADVRPSDWHSIDRQVAAIVG